MKPAPLRLNVLVPAALVLLGGAAAFHRFTTHDPPSARPEAITPAAKRERSTGAPASVDSIHRGFTLPDEAELPCSHEEGIGRVTVMAQAGRFEGAVRFALTGTSDQRPAWLGAAFSLWSDSFPDDAAAAALALNDPKSRDDAWRGVVRAWAQNQPAELAKFAATLPPGDLRLHALSDAAGRWADLNPAAAAAWIDRLEAGPECDSLVSIMARTPSLVDNQPQVALGWAESISDPALRSRTLGSVLRDWASADPAAAAIYAGETPHLFPSDREDVLVGQRFTPHP